MRCLVLASSSRGANAEPWLRDDLPTWCWRIGSLWLAGNALRYSLVGSGMVEVRLVLLHQPMQMSFAEDEEEIQALPSHTAQEAFADGICLGRAVRCPQDLYPGSGSIERRAVLGVVVADEKARSLAKRGCISQLLGDPGIGRVLVTPKWTRRREPSSMMTNTKSTRKKRS
jgi:hypothetical protein